MIYNSGRAQLHFQADCFTCEAGTLQARPAASCTALPGINANIFAPIVCLLHSWSQHGQRCCSCGIVPHAPTLCPVNHNHLEHVRHSAASAAAAVGLYMPSPCPCSPAARPEGHSLSSHRHLGTALFRAALPGEVDGGRTFALYGVLPDCMAVPQACLMVLYCKIILCLPLSSVIAG